MISRRQLLELGFTSKAIQHRLGNGRLHPIFDGVYAVGRPRVARRGRLMAAVLACGPDAALSHRSGGELFEILGLWRGPIAVTVRTDSRRHPRGISVHRRPTLPAEDFITHRGIPVTSPVRTLLDLATILPANQLEAAVNEADAKNLIDPESLRSALDSRQGQRGVKALRALLDRHTFRLTESELERRFLRVVRRAGLPLPDTQQKVGGRVDFHWPHLDLVVETDGWRYHRTPARQARDNRRMQGHAAAGRTAIRISHYEIKYEERRAESILRGLIRRLDAA